MSPWLLLAVTLTTAGATQHQPQLSPQVVTFTVAEESPPDQLIGDLRSRFSLPEGSQFAAGYPTAEVQALFSVNPSSGEIRSGQRLDRESLCPGAKRSRCERTFNVEVKRGDTGRDEVYAVHVVVSDINDQRPRFHPKNKPFLLSVAESDTPPSLYSLPMAEDVDSEAFDSVVYSLKPKDDAGLYFKLMTEERGGRTVPRLELVRPLDREVKNSYQLELLAGDAEFREDRDITEVQVRVLDANDNRPEWRLTGRSVTVSECDQLHRPLLQLRAADPDEDKRVRFRIAKTASPEVSGAFYISGDILKQNASLDYESQQQRVLYVPLVAEDYGGLASETEVEIRVTDCNDHFPNVTIQMLGGDSNAVVENDDSEKFLARVIVRDEDEGENGTVECAIGEGQRHQFDLAQKIVDGSHVTYYRLRKLPRVTFDREAASQLAGGRIAVEIVCRDRAAQPKEHRVEVPIRILDENDNSPVPEQQTYHFRVAENQPVGTFVGRVSATDRDAEENARLTYQLADKTGQLFFSLRPQGSGAGVDLFTQASFDREVRDRYDLLVAVTDSGHSVRRTATASIEVLIDDEDDSVPNFVARDYSFSMLEDYARNVSERFVGEVQASDADVGRNADIRYEVSSSYRSEGGPTFYFRGNRLHVKGNLDRERQETVSLEVLAVGRAGTGGHRGTAHVTVSLLDLNDNRPEFVELTRSCNVTEASPAGTQVMQLRGQDRDAGENGSLVYGLVGPDYGHFSVDAAHGIVTLVRSLKGTETRVFRLTARISDRGRPPLSSPAEAVFVNVVPANGEAVGRNRHPADAATPGAANRKPTKSDSEHHVVIMLCLAGIVFLVFVLLLGILVYVHLRGRQESAAAGANWGDKANGAEDEANESAAVSDQLPVSIGRPGGGQFRCPDILKTSPAQRPQQPDAGSYQAATMLIDSVRSGRRIRRLFPTDGGRGRGGVAASTLVRFPSVGYIQAAAADDADAPAAAAAPSSGSYAPVYGRNTSERLPRKVYGQSPAEDWWSSKQCGDDSPLPKVEPQKAAGSFDPHGYAVLTEAAATGPGIVRRTPYMTSSFV